MQRSGKMVAWAVPAVVVVIGAIVAWMVFHNGPSSKSATRDQDQAPTPSPQEQAPAVVALAGQEPLTTAPATIPATMAATVPAATAATAPATGPATIPSTLPSTDPLSSPQAQAAFENGLELLKAGKMIEARNALSEAVLSGQLSDQQDKVACEQLEKIAQASIFSGGVLDGDPYTFQYAVQGGDRLAAVERKLALHVPWQLLLKVNRLARAEEIRVGQQIKLVRGPFHAIVNKGKFTMDLFLQRDNLPRVWVKRIRVGLGRDGSTPVGMWRVGGGEGKKGGKLEHPTWNPPPSSDVKGPVQYGEKGYALGSKGLWIGLVGTDDNTRDKTNYGIHSTDHPESIGKEESLGCVRLADEDIDLVYALLYEVWSTVQIRP